MRLNRAAILLRMHRRCLSGFVHAGMLAKMAQTARDGGCMGVMASLRSSQCQQALMCAYLMQVGHRSPPPSIRSQSPSISKMYCADMDGDVPQLQGELLLEHPGERVTVAKAGAGGRGNTSFVSGRCVQPLEPTCRR